MIGENWSVLVRVAGLVNATAVEVWGMIIDDCRSLGIQARKGGWQGNCRTRASHQIT